LDKFNNMQVFCRIVELGTFAGVAREMGLSAMMISKYITQLEKSLGVSLLSRTTRSLSLTEAGESYYNRSKQLLDDLAALDESVVQLGQSVKGLLKISAPIDFGGLYMIPVIDKYQQQFSEVKVTMNLNNKFVNLRDGRFDISIVVTDCLDQGIVARKIATTSLSTYASPAYLSEKGCPQTLEELVQHRCLHYMDTPHGEHWMFNVAGELKKIKADWVFASNNGRALCQAAALGMGIVQVPRLSARSYLERGELVEILHKYQMPNLPIYATYLQRRFYPAKLTTFVDFVLSYFAKQL
jgi:DNA-binding transcriptional LysR family regulator